jgi:PKHD-type hydroxylase
MIAPFPVADLFAPADCAEIIRIAEAVAFRPAGLVRGRRNASIRTAELVWLDEAEGAGWVAERLMGAVAAANRAHFGFDLTEFAESAQVARYDAEACGGFDWHADCGDGPVAARRKVTLVAQLSDGADYRGGDLELNPAGQAVAGDRSRGAAILFPSFTLHRVAPVTEGRRYSLTTWVHGPAFR